MIAIISQDHLCRHASAMEQSRTYKLVSHSPYSFLKYHQNDKEVKTERLSIEGKNTAKLQYMSIFKLSLRYELY